MRIGLMLRHLGRQPGGTGTYTNMMVRHMLRLDRRNEYVLLYDDAAQLRTFDESLKVREIVLRSPLKLAWDQVMVPWIARREKLDVVFNLKLSVPLLATCLTVFVQHGADWFVMPEQYPWFDRMYFTLLAPLYWRRASCIISVSKDAQTRLASLMSPRTAAKMRTVYHGVDQRFQPRNDAAVLEPFRQRYKLDSPIVLYVGQIYGMKNVGNLIRAFLRLRDRIPHRLVLVGKAGVKSERDLALISQLNAADRISHLGWVPDEDVPLFYNVASVFAFPSIYEGFGIPIIEAMASGCPVLTSTGGACPEVAGGAALLVEPRDVDAIAEGIYRLINDAPLRQELTERGLARAREFTWENAARQTLDIIESLGDQRRQAP